MIKFFVAALSAALLTSCAIASLGNIPADDSYQPTPAPDLQLPDVIVAPLPTAIEDSVRAAYATYRQIPESRVAIMRYSREIWDDGCLGLGSLEEACLAALTEGWQVEATDTNGIESSFYRTDLTGERIRRSTLENNLPPSIGDRILKTLQASNAQSETLSIVSAEPQLWDGCYGLPADGGVCAEIAIFGWRVTATDAERYWVYHTDGLGNTLLLSREFYASDIPRKTIAIPLEDSLESKVPNSLEIEDFSLSEMSDRVGPGCSIVLRRTANDERFILHEGYLEEGRATMKIAGSWVTFLPEHGVVGINQPVRSFMSEDNQLQLTLDTPAGKKTGQELTNIPEATIEILTDGGYTATLSAVGEAGC